MNTMTTRSPMSPMRKAALIAGLAYIATFIFSIPVKFGLWADVLDKPDFILGAGSSAGVPLGAVFEVLTALGGVVSAVALYTVARRYSARAALGFVTTRLLEAAVIFVGVFSILTSTHCARTSPVRPVPTPTRSSPLAAPWSASMTGRSSSAPVSWPC